MTTESLDCSSVAPPPAASRIYHPCWGNRALPSTLNFSAGPSTPIPPNTSCNSGWPLSVITGTLTRTGPCNFFWGYSSGGSFAFYFAWTSGGPPLSCTINQSDMTLDWAISNATGTATGSCSQDPTTGIVTMTFSAIVTDGFCTCPVTITFNG